MNHNIIWEIAMQQSAIDLNCCAEDFQSGQNKIVFSKPNTQARKYLSLPFNCNLVSYGRNIVASVNQVTEPIVRNYIEKYSVEHCFETPHMNVLSDDLQKVGLKICFMAEYFLPDRTLLKKRPCAYEVRKLEQHDFQELYQPQWSNALCSERKHLDVLGIGAYDKGNLIGLAACSADCDRMWQIGVDVLPEYRRRGIACALTSILALAVMEQGKVPFYCAAWSNVGSVRNAIKSGFRPAWVEMTAKPSALVDEMNK